MTTLAASEQAEGAIRSPWLLLALVLASFFGLCAATLLLPHDPYVRYQQLSPTLHFRTVWTYERLAFDKTPIDIAIIGNSRLQSGIAAPVVQARLSERLGLPVHVANLAMPQEGRNSHDVIADQLFKHHPEVKLVLISAIEAMPRESHPAFRNIAEAPAILGAPVLINRSYLDDLAFVPFRQMSLFVQTQFPDAFGIHPFNRKDYFGADFDTTRSFVSPTAGFVDMERTNTAEQLRPSAQERVRSITPPLFPASLSWAEFSVELHYTAAIVTRARANRTAVGFLYLPIFENPAPLRQEAYYRGFGAVFTADCVAADAVNFSDYGHLNRPAAHKVSAMMADALLRAGWKPGEKAAMLKPEVVPLCRAGEPLR